MFTTDIICYPFIGVGEKLYFGSVLMISLCIFNFMLSLSVFHRKREMLHHCSRYVVALTVLGNTLVMQEMPVCALIAMLIAGSVFTDELKELHKLISGKDSLTGSQLTEDNNKICSIFLFAHLAMNYMCQMLLPVMVVAFAMANTRQSFNDVHTVSQTIFFLSSAFVLWYGVWRLRCITIAYSNAKSRLNARRLINGMEAGTAVTGISNIDMFTSSSSGATPCSALTGSYNRRVSVNTAIRMEPSSLTTQTTNPLQTIKIVKTEDNVFEPSFTF